MRRGPSRSSLSKSKAEPTPLRERLLSQLRMRSLMIFAVVIQSGGVTRASEMLGLSQPAVTRTIRELEAMLGLTLFRKAGRRRVPSPAGDTLYAYARRLLADVRAFTEEVEGREGSGHVRVGVLLAAAARLLPRAIAAAKKRAPFVTISVHEGSGVALLPALSAGEIDMIVGRISAFDRSAELRHEVLYEEPIVLCARSQHALFKGARRWPDVAQIARYPWILPPPGVALRKEIDQALELAQGNLPADVVESVSILTNRSLLLGTDTIAFLPSQVVAEDVELGLIRTMHLPFVLSDDPVGITFRSADDLSPAARQFADCVRAAAHAGTRRRRSRVS